MRYSRILTSIKTSVSIVILVYIYRNIENARNRRMHIHTVEHDATIVYQYRPSQSAVHAVVKSWMILEYERLVSARNLNKIDEFREQNKNGSVVIGIRTNCETDESNCVPKSSVHDVMFAAVPLKRLFAYLIPGNLPVTLEAILCYLTDSADFRLSQREIHLEHPHIAFCRKKTTAVAKNMDEFARSQSFFNENYTRTLLAIVRDPIERFISAFLDHCVRKSEKSGCNGCHQNITCFINSQYERLLRTPSDQLTVSDDSDFMPQNWYLDAEKVADKSVSIIKYSRNNVDDLIRQVEDRLRNCSFTPKEMEYVRSELRNYPLYAHAPTESAAYSFFEKHLRDNDDLMSVLVRMYYWDFKMFNYKIPDIPNKN